MKQYKAPWGKPLVIISVGAIILLVLISLVVVATTTVRIDPPKRWATSPASLFPLLVLFGCALFTIRHYIVTENELLIQRLLWQTRIPLQGLQSAQIDTEAFRNCIRTFGNGGLFSFTGWYRSKSVGSFRTFATDLRTPVVLRFENRTIVVTPSEPETFIRQVMTGAQRHR